MRKHLLDRRVTLRTHQRHRTIYTVANAVLMDPEENKQAVELTKRILNGNIMTNRFHVQKTEPIGEDSKSQTAHNTDMRLKDNKNKFCGNFAEYWGILRTIMTR